MVDEIKRLFFAAEVEAPWPTQLPEARLLSEKSRHMTLAFLGNVAWKPIEGLLPNIPLPSFRVGPAGFSDKCLFLPPKHPHVVAHHVVWLDPVSALVNYQRDLTAYWSASGYSLDDRPFLPHVTIARSPFDQEEWRQAFHPLPMMIRGIHLYQSMGNFVYEPIWSHLLQAPFIEIPHTADIAFEIYAETMQTIGFHAQIALAFKHPGFLKYLQPIAEDCTLDDIVISLNESVTRADIEEGSALKAVSFHGDVVKKNGLLTWEMVVDV